MSEIKTLDDLRQLSRDIVGAEKKYYDLDYQYRQIVDKISYMEADLLVNGELKGKTLRDREAEAQLHTAPLQNDKRKLFYEANLAKSDKEFLKRQYAIELLAVKWKRYDNTSLQGLEGVEGIDA